MSNRHEKNVGRAKQIVGDLIGDEDVEQEGERDETAGKAKEAVDTVSDAIKDAIDSGKDELDD